MDSMAGRQNPDFVEPPKRVDYITRSSCGSCLTTRKSRYASLTLRFDCTYAIPYVCLRVAVGVEGIVTPAIHDSPVDRRLLPEHPPGKTPCTDFAASYVSTSSADGLTEP